MMRVCTRCREQKDDGHFYKRSSGGLTSHCKPCVIAGQQELKRRDPEHFNAVRRRASRKYSLKNRYGLDQQAYDKLYSEQQGKCSICKADFSVLHVDHDHDSGEIRGLLCGSCNRGLGLFADEVERLLAAAEYLGGRHE